jgi:ubiquinone/menaquinone biosynthesis C-methylase UbiE
MERFWDARARENAAYFVDNRLDYAESDMETFWARGRETVDALFAQLGLRIEPSDTIVEVGCGIGRLTRVFAERASHVWAFDVSSEMIRRAREELSEVANIEWVHGDGTTLQPVPDGAASGCFSFVVFQHIPDPAITLGYVREMGRVLRPGGWSAFQISNDPGIHRPPRPSLGNRVKARLGRAPKGQDHPAWLGSAVDLDDLTRVAGESGLDVERVENPGTQFCMVLLRRRNASEH